MVKDLCSYVNMLIYHFDLNNVDSEGVLECPAVGGDLPLPASGDNQQPSECAASGDNQPSECPASRDNQLLNGLH